jgi:hypothetical protein
MLDRRDTIDVSMQGIILLNLYSDDRLTSIDISKLWDKFMLDFKNAFEVGEKDPDYFLGCAIEWDPETGVIQLDASKYLREVRSRVDLSGEVIAKLTWLVHTPRRSQHRQARRFMPTKIGMTTKNLGTYISNIAVASTTQH